MSVYLFLLKFFITSSSLATKVHDDKLILVQQERTTIRFECSAIIENGPSNTTHQILHWQLNSKKLEWSFNVQQKKMH